MKDPDWGDVPNRIKAVLSPFMVMVGDKYMHTSPKRGRYQVQRQGKDKVLVWLGSSRDLKVAGLLAAVTYVDPSLLTPNGPLRWLERMTQGDSEVTSWLRSMERKLAETAPPVPQMGGRRRERTESSAPPSSRKAPAVHSSTGRKPSPAGRSSPVVVEAVALPQQLSQTQAALNAIRTTRRVYSQLHGGRAEFFPLVKTLQKRDLAKTELLLGQNLYADALPKREYDHLLGVLTHRTVAHEDFRDEVASVLETLFGYQRRKDGTMVHLELPRISLREPHFRPVVLRNSLLFHMFLKDLVLARPPEEDEEDTDVVDGHSDAEWDVVDGHSDAEG